MSAIEPKQLTAEELEYFENTPMAVIWPEVQGLLAHIAYLEARIAALEDAQPRVVPPGYFTGSDNDAGT